LRDALVVSVAVPMVIDAPAACFVLPVALVP
jgi:hypothetical protein